MVRAWPGIGALLSLLPLHQYACAAPEPERGREREASELDEPEEETREPSPPSTLQPGWQLSLFAGYGADLLEPDSYPETGGEDDPLGAGAGLRLRYQLEAGLTLGLRFSHHFGVPAGSIQLSVGQVEAGWALPLGPLRGEMFVGAGVQRTWQTTELCQVGGQCTSVDLGSAGLAVGLGLTLAFPFADRYFVGATGEALLASDIMAAAFYGSLGMTF